MTDYQFDTRKQAQQSIRKPQGRKRKLSLFSGMINDHFEDAQRLLAFCSVSRSQHKSKNSTIGARNACESKCKSPVSAATAAAVAVDGAEAGAAVPCSPAYPFDSAPAAAAAAAPTPLLQLRN